MCKSHEINLIIECQFKFVPMGRHLKVKVASTSWHCTFGACGFLWVFLSSPSLLRLGAKDEMAGVIGTNLART